MTGQDIKALRSYLDWRQTDLAVALGVTVRQVQNLERDGAAGTTSRLLSAFKADWSLAHKMLEGARRAPEIGRECFEYFVKQLAAGEEIEIEEPLPGDFDYLKGELEIDLSEWPWVVELFAKGWADARRDYDIEASGAE